jgi:hypothetical protein
MRGTEYMPKDKYMVWIFLAAAILRKSCTERRRPMDDHTQAEGTEVGFHFRQDLSYLP